jgi:extradiol dioxygenase
MEVLSLGYIGIESPAYAEWRSFGPDIFGLAIGEDGADGAVRLRMDDRAYRFAIHPGEIDQLSYIGWELRNSDAFEAGVKQLQDAGYDPVVGDQALADERKVQGVAHFRDPAGFRHEIFYSQTFMPGSFLPGKPSHGFVGDNLGIPHLVLFVPRVTPELKRFATEVMGFQLLAEYPIIAWNGKPGGPSFYRCNGRSHCIGYLGLEGHRGLGHICIEGKSLDDVGKAYDLVQRRHIPINLTLGRHALDTMVSFYCRTPSGFTIEFGWDGETINDESFVQQRPSDYEVWGHERGPGGLPLTVVPVED